MDRRLARIAARQLVKFRRGASSRGGAAPRLVAAAATRGVFRRSGGVLGALPHARVEERRELDEDDVEDDAGSGWR